MMKLWAKIYQLTGWYSPFAQVKEYEYIYKILPQIEKQYNKKTNDMSLQDLVGLEIGLWQAHKGIYRKGKL